MKSMNCISAMGRIPISAAPDAAPMMAISEIGVSTTRSGPKRSMIPALVLNAPPYAPTSSPMRNTRSSRAISSSIALRMASMYVVSGIPVSVPGPQPLARILALRHRRALRLVHRRVEIALDALLDLLELFRLGDPALGQRVLVAHERVLRAPLLDQLGRDIRLVVVLGVALHAERLHLEQCDAAAIARAIDRFFRGGVHREDVVAVDRVADASEGGRLVGELLRRGLLRGRRGVGVAVVFHDHDERQLLYRREVHPLPERAGRGAAVADEGESDELALLHPPREGDAGHDRDHVAEHGDLADEAVGRGIAEVDV